MAIQVVVTAACSLIVDHAGRRPLLMLSLGGMTAGYMALAYFFINGRQPSWLALGSLLGYMISFAGVARTSHMPEPRRPDRLSACVRLHERCLLRWVVIAQWRPSPAFPRAIPGAGTDAPLHRRVAPLTTMSPLSPQRLPSHHNVSPLTTTSPLSP